MIIYQWDKVLLLCYILIFNGVLSAVILRNKLFQKTKKNLSIIYNLFKNRCAYT